MLKCPVQLKKLLINRLNEEFKGDPHHFLRQDGKPVGLHVYHFAYHAIGDD
jgi:hypothetical protein